MLQSVPHIAQCPRGVPHLLYEFFTRTASPPFCSAGCIASGCSTAAPKYASSVASSKVSSGMGAALATMRGSLVRTPAVSKGT